MIMHTNVLTNRSSEMANSEQEPIVVNKSGLINDISNLLIAGFTFGVMIGATIMQVIIRYN